MSSNQMSEQHDNEDAARGHHSDDDDYECDIQIPSLFYLSSLASVVKNNNEEDPSRKNRNSYDAVWFTSASSSSQYDVDDDYVEKTIFVIGEAESNYCRLVVVRREALSSTNTQQQQQQQQQEQIVVQFPETDIVEALCFVRDPTTTSYLSSQQTQTSDEIIGFARIRLVVLTRAGELFHASLDRLLNIGLAQPIKGTQTKGNGGVLHASQVLTLLSTTTTATISNKNSSLLQGMSRLVSCDDMPGWVLVGGSPTCTGEENSHLEEPRLFMIPISPTSSTTKQSVPIPITGLSILSSQATNNRFDTTKGGSTGGYSTTSITSMILAKRSAMEPEFARSLEQRLWSVFSMDAKTSMDGKYNSGNSQQARESVSATTTTTTTTTTENEGDRNMHAFVFVGLRDGSLWASGVSSNNEKVDENTNLPNSTDAARLLESVTTCSILHLIGWLAQEQSLIDIILTRNRGGLFNGLLCIGAHGDMAHMASNGTLIRLRPLEGVGQWTSAFSVHPWKDRSTIAADRIMVWTTNQTTSSTHLQYWELSAPIGHDSATSSSSSIVPIRSDLQWTMPIRAVGGDVGSQMPALFFLGRSKQGTLMAFKVPNEKEYALQDWLLLSGEGVTEQSDDVMPRGTLRRFALKNKARALNGHDRAEADCRKRIKRHIKQCTILDATQSVEVELAQRREYIQKMANSNLAILRVQHDAASGNALAINGGIETTGSNRIAAVQLQEGRRGTSSFKDLAATLHVCDAQASDAVCARRAYMDVHYGGSAFSFSTTTRSNKQGDTSASQAHRVVLPISQNTTTSTYVSLAPDYLAMDYHHLVHPVNDTDHNVLPKSRLGEVMVVAEQMLEEEI